MFIYISIQGACATSDLTVRCIITRKALVSRQRTLNQTFPLYLRVCLQIHPGGLRHIRPDRRINEWKVPGRRQINKATSNEHQVGMGAGVGVDKGEGEGA